MLKIPVSSKPILPGSNKDFYRQIQLTRKSTSIQRNLRQERQKSVIQNNHSFINDSQSTQFRRSNSQRQNNSILINNQSQKCSFILADLTNISIKLQNNHRKKQISYSEDNKENITILNAVNSNNYTFYKVNQEQEEAIPFLKKIDFYDFKQRLRFPQPKITAKCWCIFELSSCKMIWGQKCQYQREVASLTKIMTILTAIKLCKQMRINFKETFFKISRTAILLPGIIIKTLQFKGTSANLKQNTWLNVQDLFYAILLPSGNDAAYALAENLGGLYSIYTQFDICGKLELLLNDRSKRQELSNLIFSINQPVNYFINEMNKLTKELNIYNSTWANPHGLSNKNRYNKSSAYDIGRLSCKAMQNELFRQIVKTKEHTAVITNEEGKLYEQSWVNTNKLLDEGWEGIKTGITNPAGIICLPLIFQGPCLSSCANSIVSDSNQQFSFVIILLGSQTMEHRWDESKALLNWVSGND